MNILALDTATRTGWAVTSLKSGHHIITTSGVEDFSIRTRATKTLAADHPGLRFESFRVWLKNHIYTNNIDLIVYESVVGGASAGGKTSLIQKGLEALVYAVAYQMDSANILGIPVWSFSAATIKKWATGDGRLTHESKAELVRLAVRKWHHSTLMPHKATKSQPWNYDDNQCDALWLSDLVVHVVRELQTRAASSDSIFDAASMTDQLTPLAQTVTSRKWSPAKKR